uniref:Uncharacterized protein n=1 Tax=Arsenophonus nasoniae TaxID=638 RepID=D2U066_9GAMM|nr:hypothetical protein ARN_18720 [Arsenophonus nasoniae]
MEKITQLTVSCCIKCVSKQDNNTISLAKRILVANLANFPYLQNSITVDRQLSNKTVN